MNASSAANLRTSTISAVWDRRRFQSASPEDVDALNVRLHTKIEIEPRPPKWRDEPRGPERR